MISILAPARSWPEGNSEDTDSDGNDDDACDYDDDDEIKMKCFESIPGQAYRRGEKKKRKILDGPAIFFHGEDAPIGK